MKEDWSQLRKGTTDFFVPRVNKRAFIPRHQAPMQKKAPTSWKAQSSSMRAMVVLHKQRIYAKPENTWRQKS
jgi:hypothetical protein